MNPDPAIACPDGSDVLLHKGFHAARMARGDRDLARIHALRGLCFLGSINRADRDALDAQCQHVIVEDTRTGVVVCCYRLLCLPPAQIERSYSAQFYDLSALARYPGTLMEVGRFCIHPNHAADMDILRIAWGTLTRLVDAQSVALLFGCSSFQGTDPAQYDDCFAVLRDKHLAPAHWRPGPRAAQRISLFPERPTVPGSKPQAMPPLLKTYLLMGGWVSDHAVVDTQMNTLHVFTGVEVARIPKTRQRLLRALAT